MKRGVLSQWSIPEAEEKFLLLKLLKIQGVGMGRGSSLSFSLFHFFFFFLNKVTLTSGS